MCVYVYGLPMIVCLATLQTYRTNKNRIRTGFGLTDKVSLSINTYKNMVILPYNGKKKLSIVNSKQGKTLVGSTGLEWVMECLNLTSVPIADASIFKCQIDSWMGQGSGWLQWLAQLGGRRWIVLKVHALTYKIKE